jgi:plasmid stabilization system protein ParE
MAKKRRFHPTVADDLKFATDYYDDISVDLGNHFRSTFRDRLRDLSQRPESFGCVHGILRVATVHRFPYVLLFENRDEFIAILGVFHAASDQSGWFERSM